MKLVTAVCAFVFIASSASAQLVPLRLNPMTDVLAELKAPTPARPAIKPMIEQLGGYSVDVPLPRPPAVDIAQLDRAVFEAELRVLQTATAYAEATATAADWTIMMNRFPQWQPPVYRTRPSLPPLRPLSAPRARSVHCSSMLLGGQFVETTCQ
jgi:hypothetical protein